MSDDLSLFTAESRQGTHVLNTLALGAIYAASMFFAVAFSPNMGYVAHPQGSSANSRVAAISGEIASTR